MQTRLPAELRQAFRDALCDAYRQIKDLEMMVKLCLDQNLAEISAPADLRQTAFNLVEWAEEQGHLDELVDCARRGNPGNPQLGAAVERYHAWHAQVAAIEPPPSPTPAELTTDDHVLVEQLARGEVAPLVGAGLSMGAGLPGWYELNEELAQRTGQTMPPREWATADQLIAIAQTYINRQGLFSLISYLQERLDSYRTRPTAAHRALVQLPVNLVFTANFDDLLERAYRDAQRPVKVIVRDGDIPFMGRDPNTVNIVKLHGDLNQPDTVVLAKEQYERYFLDRPQLTRLLEADVARSTMLYLGWSHTDPAYNLIFGQLLARFGEMSRMGYAAMFDIKPEQAEEFRRKKIRLVQLPAGSDKTAVLAAWLRTLATGQ